jgi:hypothetical protein
MFDDNEEHLLLTDFLRIENQVDMDINKTQIPEELIDVLNYFSSEEQQDKLLESFALSKIIDVLNP